MEQGENVTVTRPAFFGREADGALCFCQWYYASSQLVTIRRSLDGLELLGEYCREDVFSLQQAEALAGDILDELFAPEQAVMLASGFLILSGRSTTGPKTGPGPRRRWTIPSSSSSFRNFRTSGSAGWPLPPAPCAWTTGRGMHRPSRCSAPSTTSSCCGTAVGPTRPVPVPCCALMPGARIGRPLFPTGTHI